VFGLEQLFNEPRDGTAWLKKDVVRTFRVNTAGGVRREKSKLHLAK